MRPKATAAPLRTPGRTFVGVAGGACHPAALLIYPPDAVEEVPEQRCQVPQNVRYTRCSGPGGSP